MKHSHAFVEYRKNKIKIWEWYIIWNLNLDKEYQGFFQNTSFSRVVVHSFVPLGAY